MKFYSLILTGHVYSIFLLMCPMPLHSLLTIMEFVTTQIIGLSVFTTSKSFAFLLNMEIDLHFQMYCVFAC